jgi:hypothetical protein
VYLDPVLPADLAHVAQASGEYQQKDVDHVPLDKLDSGAKPGRHFLTF